MALASENLTKNQKTVLNVLVNSSEPMKAPLTAGSPEDAHEPEPPPRGASMFSATINLANSILGAGTLAIPYAFAGSMFIFKIA